LSSIKSLRLVNLPAKQIPIYIKAMQFYANHVYTLVDDDSYAVIFAEEDTDDWGRYLFIQRRLASSDDNTRYIETHDGEYSGHFLVHKIEFTATHLLVEFNFPRGNLIKITFDLAPSKFSQVSRVIDIIRGDSQLDLC
jgi:hypothetical protein